MASTTITCPVLPLRNMVLFPSPHTAFPVAVGRPRSIKLLEDVAGSDKTLVLIAQKDEGVEDPTMEDLHEVGTLATILKVISSSSDESYNIIVQGTQKVKLISLSEVDGYHVGTFEVLEDVRSFDEMEIALIKTLRETATELITSVDSLPAETVQMLTRIEDPSELTNFLAHHALDKVQDKQDMLEETDVNTRLENCIRLLTGHLKVAEVSEKIKKRIHEDTERNQREYYLRQQMKAIQEQLGTADDDMDELEARIEDSGMPEAAFMAAMKQYNRLQGMQPSSSEYSVTLNYIETLLDLPWAILSDDQLDLVRAQGILDTDHYGLDKVKDRIVEYLAVCSLKSEMKGPILCLHGPPGVGKTSLAQSIARTLGRKFIRISLGGVHDESEIRGHRRTYVGAMPGRLAQALIKAGTCNPVILLDEIDKVGRDFRGDPSAALLEVLDPEQNHTFSDHFVEVPLDLSKVLFIATANQLDTISPPLRDRMEIIDVPSYTSYEKQHIAQKYLIPKQIKEHGLTEENVTFMPDAVSYVIDRYTREAGVRSLERRVADLCRKSAVAVAKAAPEDRPAYNTKVDEAYVETVLGPERYISEVAQRTNMVGVATGLAWTQSGGDILFIEAQKMPGKGELKLTGQLGDVMKESVHAALSYIRSNVLRFGLTEDFNKTVDIHLHVPAGAIPKDGPSAGITMFTAILSRLTDVPVRRDMAMTGEITLSGNVLPVGGIKEKIIAAHRAGITSIVMPKICMKDLVDVDASVKDDITFYPVDNVEELLELVFEEFPAQPS